MYFDEVQLAIVEGINDPGIFKAIFTAGGPGSGKSTVASNLGLFAMGARPINSDAPFEHALKKAGHSLKLGSLDPELIDTMRIKAKKLSNSQMDLAVQGRLGLVIDSTARNIERIAKQKAALEAIGYETAMLFVDTSLETALERNRMRPRSVPEKIVTGHHKEITAQRNKLKSLFGQNFWVIQNDGDMRDLEKNTTKWYSKVSSWMKKLPTNAAAKKWMSQFESVNEVDLEKHKAQIDQFGKLIATVSNTKYDPEKPIDSLELAFKVIRAGRWSPKQWELIQKMVKNLDKLDIKLKSLKGMYMGLDKQSKAQYYEGVLTELDLRNPQKRNVSRMAANMDAFEKKLYKKMMGDPKKATMELEAAIKVFKKYHDAAVSITQPIIMAQIKKYEKMLAALRAKPVTEDVLLETMYVGLSKMNPKQFFNNWSNDDLVDAIKDAHKTEIPMKLLKMIKDEMKRRKIKEAVQPKKGKVKLECMECGKKFMSSKPTASTKCPKCKGSDIELAERKGPTAKEIILGMSLESVKTTAENPLVVIWSKSKSVDYPEQGIIGHMNLSTAADIHSFDQAKALELLNKAGKKTGKRVQVKSNVYLEWSKWNAKYIKEETVNEAAVRLPPDVNDVKMSTLYVLLNNAITKKMSKLPSSAPIVLQMLQSLTAVKASIRPDMNLTGYDAIKAFANATSGHFTSDMPPLSTLARKYKIKTDFRGNLVLEVEGIPSSDTNTASIPPIVTPDSTFAGHAVFDCDDETFSNCIKGKKKHGRWSTYLGQGNPFYDKMKSWMGQSYKNKNFIMRNAKSGAMVYARNPLGEQVDEASFDLLPISNAEAKAFADALRKYEKQMEGFQFDKKPEMVANQLVQKGQTTNWFRPFTITFSKQKDVFKLGSSKYDIRYADNNTTSQATVSQSFTKSEDVALLKRELKRFFDTVFKKGISS